MEEEEELDPRVQVELEVLNTATDDINKLEAKLEEANNAFRTTLSESTVRLKTLAKKLGSCIEKARPYYEALELARTSQLDCQRAAVQYQRANALHQAAKETIAKAEGMFVHHHDNRHFDSTWQEVLNRAIIKVMEAEAQKASSEREHLKRAATYQQAEQQVQQLHRGLRSSIAKSTVYFEEKARVQSQLETQKEHVQRLQQAITASKTSYAQSLRRLEQISEQIHEQRRCRLPREPGVGAELPPAAATDNPTSTTSSFLCPPTPTGIAAAATSFPRPPAPTHDHTVQDEQYWENLREKLAKLEEADGGGEDSRGSDGSMEEEEMRERSVSGSSSADDVNTHAHQHAPHTSVQGAQHMYTHTQGEQQYQHHLPIKTRVNTHPSTTLSAPHSIQSCQPKGRRCRREDAGVIVPVGEGGREQMIEEERRVEEEEEERVRKGPVGGDCDTENYFPCNTVDSLDTEKSIVSSRAVQAIDSSPNRQQQIESNRKESLKIGDIHIILCVDEDDGDTQTRNYDNSSPTQDEIDQPEHRQASGINSNKSSCNEGLRTADGEYENMSYGALEDAKIDMHGDGNKVASVQYKEIKGMVEMHEVSESENVMSMQCSSVKNMARTYDEKVCEVAAGIQYSAEIDDDNEMNETGREVKNEASGMCNSEASSNELTELCNKEYGNEVNESCSEVNKSSSEKKDNKTDASYSAVNNSEVLELYCAATDGIDDETMPLGRSSPPPALCIPSRDLGAIPEELEVCVMQE